MHTAGALLTPAGGVDLKRKMMPERESERCSSGSLAPATFPKLISQHSRCFMSTKRACPCDVSAWPAGVQDPCMDECHACFTRIFLANAHKFTSSHPPTTHLASSSMGR